jgi:hypothetical protein
MQLHYRYLQKQYNHMKLAQIKGMQIIVFLDENMQVCNLYVSALILIFKTKTYNAVVYLKYLLLDECIS